MATKPEPQQDPKSSESSSPKPPNTAKRIIGGIALIAFALIGGFANINKPLTGSATNRLLEQASRPLDNGMTIFFMGLIILFGLALIFKAPKK